jgi:hypothetical protein
MKDPVSHHNMSGALSIDIRPQFDRVLASEYLQTSINFLGSSHLALKIFSLLRIYVYLGIEAIGSIPWSTCPYVKKRKIYKKMLRAVNDIDIICLHVILPTKKVPHI